jgi:hypothetical protein
MILFWNSALCTASLNDSVAIAVDLRVHAIECNDLFFACMANIKHWAGPGFEESRAIFPPRDEP